MGRQRHHVPFGKGFDDLLHPRGVGRIAAFELLDVDRHLDDA